MPEPATLLAFTAAAGVLILVPGPNLIYIVTRSIAQGRNAGLVSALGVETGTLVHVIAAAVGVSSLVMASDVALSVLKYAGALYLLYLAVRALRSASELDLSGSARPVPLARIYRDGVLVNVLNPKVLLFFLAFLPQFVTPGADAATARTQILVLGAAFFVVALVLDVIYALAGGALSRWLRGRPAAMDRQRYAVAGVYVVLAAYAALSGGSTSGEG